MSDLLQVAKAGKPSADFMEWWKTFPLNTYGIVPAFHGWEAGQRAERERCREIVKTMGESDVPELLRQIDNGEE